MTELEEVYPPSEDTYLLLDALLSSLPSTRPQLLLELGVGSGFIVRELRAHLHPASVVFATDINRAALACARGLSAGGRGPAVEVLAMDLLAGFARGLFDVVAFNPPYVPTGPAELANAQRAGDLSAAWAGGKDGRELIDRVMRAVRRVLAENGEMFLVALEQNGPEELMRMGSAMGFHASIAKQRRAGFENLFVLRFRPI